MYDAHKQRGVTMVSVMLMTVSLMTLGLLAVRSSTRDATAAGQLVARERALLVAQAAVDLAAAEYMGMGNGELDAALVGYNPQGASCTDPCGDCIPEATGYVTGQRNEVLDGNPIGCGGRPCMRQGAVARLPDSSRINPTDWCDVPFRDLVSGGDAEAHVSVWVRNNASDAIGVNADPAGWLGDTDGRVVITAMARLRNTVVTVEKEVALSSGEGAVMQPLSPDEGYGGGHNNDNSAVSMCTDDFVSAVAAGP